MKRLYPIFNFNFLRIKAHLEKTYLERKTFLGGLNYLIYVRKEWGHEFDRLDDVGLSGLHEFEHKYPNAYPPRLGDFDRSFLSKIDREIEYVRRCLDHAVVEFKHKYPLEFYNEIRAARLHLPAKDPKSDETSAESAAAADRKKIRWIDSLAQLTREIAGLAELGDWPQSNQWQFAADRLVDKNSKPITATQLSSTYDRAKRKQVPSRQDLRDLLLQARNLQ